MSQTKSETERTLDRSSPPHPSPPKVKSGGGQMTVPLSGGTLVKSGVVEDITFLSGKTEYDLSRPGNASLVTRGATGSRRRLSYIILLPRTVMR